MWVITHLEWALNGKDNEQSSLLKAIFNTILRKTFLKPEYQTKHISCSSNYEKRDQNNDKY